jgi:hypothetical protein
VPRDADAVDRVDRRDVEDDVLVAVVSPFHSDDVCGLARFVAG